MRNCTFLGFGVGFLAFAATAGAQTAWLLDDPASPISAVFHTGGARFVVTHKATGFVWHNPDSGGGDTLTVSVTTQPDPRHLAVQATTQNGYAITLAIELRPANGDLVVTISGSATLAMPAGIKYPKAFLPVDGSGFAVLPLFSGYVVPTTATTWSAPPSHSRMEWFGGTDAQGEAGWMCIGDPAADMLLVKQTGTLSGVSGSRLSGVFDWRGSNGSPGGAVDRLTYDRTATFRFFAAGGHAAQAKRFRDFAIGKGWHRSLADKQQANADVGKLLGAPVIYLWGDGRSTAMLDALQQAGIDRALVQLSINQVDHLNAFPNQPFANGPGWANAVRTRGFVAGIYDLYVRYAATQTSPPFNGFFYLWPTLANPQWIYVDASGALVNSDICAQRAWPFARDVRLPAHIAQFGLDAFFFDVTCAQAPREDYDALYGHRATRSQDIDYRRALLATASVDHNKICGSEQARSWAVPAVHWCEGNFRLGATGPQGSYGTWNNSAYPAIMTDVMSPGANLASLLTTGYQAPLWDLVYHDTMLSSQHWSMAHNKLLYVWDHADRCALLRGQVPLLNLTYDAQVGTVGRVISGAVDQRDQSFWDTRWTNPNVSARVVQTFQTVCAWHRRIGDLAMLDHRFLSTDRAVQLSEFSGDGGTSGAGIVVNFGTFDGSFGVNGPTWTGTLRGHPLAVAAGSFATYSWGGFADRGGGHPGAAGVPVHTGTGTFTVGSTMTLVLQAAAPTAPAALVFGFNESPMALLGGVLVPTPDIVVGGTTDGTGAAQESFVWPAAMPARTTFTSQWLVLDAGAVGGVAFSNALRGASAP